MGEASVTRPSDCPDACQSDTMLISPLNSSQSENHKINGKRNGVSIVAN